MSSVQKILDIIYYFYNFAKELFGKYLLNVGRMSLNQRPSQEIRSSVFSNDFKKVLIFYYYCYYFPHSHYYYHHFQYLLL